jgi:S1-C subfamily serine protease
MDEARRALAIGTSGDRDRVSDQRAASALAALQKTLVHERTRGAKDVAVYQRAAPAVVRIVAGDQGDRLGSGAIIDNEGHIITNWHVVGEEHEVLVVLKPNDSTELRRELVFSATVEKTDSVADLALLKLAIPPSALRPLQLGDIGTLAVGQDVHAIGHPNDEVWTYTKGTISQIRPSYSWSDGKDSHRANIVQTQTPLNPGNSGGPLLDDAARIIGLNTFKGSGESLNYAVAVDEIQSFLRRSGGRPPQSPPSAPSQSRCTEQYDTTGRGWKNIAGCYVSVVSPPPNFWLVTRLAGQGPAYRAEGPPSGKIDTIIIPSGKDRRQLDYYIDLDCDGRVDLIRGSIGDRMFTYRLPIPAPTLASLAPELAAALQLGKLPYPALRLCP